MGVDRAIRGLELAMALCSSYLSALLLVKSGLYLEFKNFILPILTLLGLPLEAYIDLIPLSVALSLSLLIWRRGSESAYAKLFSLNLLMFFPAILDYSHFNWIMLMLPYTPRADMPLLTFITGLMLQTSYLTIRSTLLIRHVRMELLSRGAEPEDVEAISRGQMAYLSLTLTASILMLSAIYLTLPHLETLMRLQILGIPYTHLIIGLSATLLIAVATLLFLKGWKS
ncbi:hypothetical protein CW701_02375 [Candidatus Bathyarchaeota archaeon]|nr:MAG: hypothetical protein CW701_02375 [Candidatus Bathyarchaeota archaeon]RLI16338.1 MAG: hypothetical protein DRO49_04775 [Candidatus Bathyarchaeota archaeon]